MEPGEYEALRARAAGGGSAAAELLQFMRTQKIHQPEVVLLHGGELLSRGCWKLGGDLWSILEQVAQAAAELDHAGWRDFCLEKLAAKFPSSSRVDRLKGQCAEARGDWGEAKKIYEAVLANKPEDTLAQKRLIAMKKQKGMLQEAITDCNTYLETFSSDAEAWHELAELYLEAGSLQRSLFCFEELLVSNPRSMYHVLVYAELAYSTGEFELARKYFSLAAYLDGANLRALWGLLTCFMALAEKDKTSEKMGQLKTYTIERLNHAYKAQGTGKAGKIAMLLLDTELVKGAQ